MCVRRIIRDWRQRTSAVELQAARARSLARLEEIALTMPAGYLAFVRNPMLMAGTVAAPVVARPAPIVDTIGRLSTLGVIAADEASALTTADAIPAADVATEPEMVNLPKGIVFLPAPSQPVAAVAAEVGAVLTGRRMASCYW